MNVANGTEWLVVEPNTVRYASIVLSALGPCMTFASTSSNLLFVASEIDIKYFALLYVAELNESNSFDDIENILEEISEVNSRTLYLLSLS